MSKQGKGEESKKKSFVLYVDAREQIAMLNDVEAGILFKAIIDFADTGQQLDTSSLPNMAEGQEINARLLEYAFKGYQAQIVRDGNRWKEIRDKRRDAGGKGGKAKASNAKQKLANVANAKNDKQKLANVAVSVSDSVNVSVSDSDNVIEKGKEDPAPDPDERFTKYEAALKRDCPNVARMDTQLTPEQFNKLLNLFDGQSAILWQAIQKLENSKEGTKKNRSIYLTLTNWNRRGFFDEIKREFYEQHTGTNDQQTEG